MKEKTKRILVVGVKWRHRANGLFKYQRRSCKLSFLFPPRRQSALESMLAGYTTLKTLAVQKMDIAILLLINRDLDKKQKWYQIPATPQKKQQLG